MDGSSSLNVSNLYFDDGISISQTDAHGNTCTVQLKASNIVVESRVVHANGCRVLKDGTVEPALFYFVDFDVVKMVKCKFSGSPNWYSGRERAFPLAKMVYKFKTVRLMLPPHEGRGLDPDPQREPESVMAHLKYLASNKAGQTSQEHWLNIFEPTPGKSKSEQNRDSSQAKHQERKDREAENPKENCDPFHTVPSADGRTNSASGGEA